MTRLADRIFQSIADALYTPVVWVWERVGGWHDRRRCEWANLTGDDE